MHGFWGKNHKELSTINLVREGEGEGEDKKKIGSP